MVNGSEMGTEITSSVLPTIKVRCACPTDIQQITIIKNGKDIHIENPVSSRVADITWKDTELSDSAYYYVRIKMKGNKNRDATCVAGRTEFAWSSPVWITKK